MPLINVNARVAVCGQISQYNLEKPEAGPRWLWALLVKQPRSEAFWCLSLSTFPEGLREMAQWLKQGKLKYQEDIAQGLENAPEAFIGMLRGRNFGKQLVQVSDWTA